MTRNVNEISSVASSCTTPLDFRSGLSLLPGALPFKEGYSSTFARGKTRTVPALDIKPEWSVGCVPHRPGLPWPPRLLCQTAGLTNVNP